MIPTGASLISDYHPEQPMARLPGSPLACLGTVLIVAFVVLALVKGGGSPPDLVETTHRLAPVMGDSCLLSAVVPTSELEAARKALEAGEEELRRVEAMMSVHRGDSEISRLNAAAAGDIVRLSLETIVVLRAAKLAFEATGGAFDVTCRPLVRVWQTAGVSGEVPTGEVLVRARAASTWDHFELRRSAVVKSVATACVDLGGVARGFAIDNAIDVMRAAGCVGGMVKVGGDVRTFGPGPAGVVWQVELQDPFAGGVWGRLPAGGAVCTSGSSARRVTARGRHSHIVDPRTGQSVDLVPSVTVTSISAETADIWATALSVLGAEGFAMLPAGSGMEAMLVAGPRNNYKVKMTAGFQAMLRGKVVFEAEVQ